MQTKFLFIFLQLICLICLHFNFTNCYKYRNRNRSRGLSSHTHNAQALTAAESTSSSSNSNNQQSQIECDFLLHKETGCEDEIGSRCDPNTSKCVCRESHPIRLLDFCLKVSRLNGPCYTSGQCSIVSKNASCYIFGKEYDLETGSGSHNLGRFVKNWPLGVCKCRLGFAYNATTNQCEKRLVGSFCSTNSHCLLRSINSVCDKKRGECECAWNTFYEPKLDTCLPDTSPNAINNGIINNSNYGSNNRQVYYMSKCEQDLDCSLSATLTSPTINNQQPQPPSSSSGISSTSTSPQSSVTTSSPPLIVSSTSPSRNLNQSVANLVQPSLANENSSNHNNLLLEQADQENTFNQIRYLHGHRRLKDGLRRSNSNYHLRELQCIRGRCVCLSLHMWDGHVHCKVPYDSNQSNSSSTHRHNRKNHNSFNELDDELGDEFGDDGSIFSWQTIFLFALGSILFAGFIFRYSYYRKGEDDELSEGLRSPDGLYAHKTILGREHSFNPPYNPVAVAFLSKPNPSMLNGASCGSNHYDPGYGYSTPCYHEYDYGGYNMCNGPHTMMGHPLQQQQQIQNSLGKPPNEEDEDAYLQQNPDENCEKKDESIADSTNQYDCIQCGHIRNPNSSLAASSHPSVNSDSTIKPTTMQPTICCGCDFTTTAIVHKSPGAQFPRSILDQYTGSLADGSLNSTVGLRDVIDCVTPATTTTTTCGRASSSGNTTTNEEEDESSNKSTNELTNQLENEKKMKELHLSNLLTQNSDLGGSEEDSQEDTTDENIAILNRKTRSKDQTKKWRPASNMAETSTDTNLTSSSNSPAKNSNKSNVSLLIESQIHEQFQIA